MQVEPWQSQVDASRAMVESSSVTGECSSS